MASNPVVCHNCGQRGHISIGCPKSQRDNRCYGCDRSIMDYFTCPYCLRKKPDEADDQIIEIGTRYRRPWMKIDETYRLALPRERRETYGTWAKDARYNNVAVFPPHRAFVKGTEWQQPGWWPGYVVPNAPESHSPKPKEKEQVKPLPEPQKPNTAAESLVAQDRLPEPLANSTQAAIAGVDQRVEEQARTVTDFIKQALLGRSLTLLMPIGNGAMISLDYRGQQREFEHREVSYSPDDVVPLPLMPAPLEMATDPSEARAPSAESSDDETTE